MATTITFEARHLKRLVDVTRSAARHAPLPAHLSDQQFWKAGAKAHPILGMAMPEDVDESKIKPHLVITHDNEGLRLESSAFGSAERVFARNADPSRDHLDVLADFDINLHYRELPIEWAERALAAGVDMHVHVSPLGEIKPGRARAIEVNAEMAL